MRIVIFLLFLLSSLFSSLLSGSDHGIPVAWDRAQDGPWLTQESAHFLITYDEKNSALANKSLNIAERIHQELLPFFGSSPAEKTHMVLVDDFDVSNGWATFFPYAQMRLYTTAPDTITGLEERDDWLHTLIRHEYVHILHMEMAAGLPKFMRNILGRLVVLFPHTITPSFMLEGLATYLETNEKLNYGRLQSAYYAMQMRMEVNAGQLKSLSAVSAPLRELPLGMQYLYGSYFYQFLAEKQGEEKIKQYLKQYSRVLVPGFFQNKTAKQVFGKSISSLWQDYHAWLNAKFSAQIKDLNRLAPELVVAKRGLRTDFQGDEYGLFQDSSASQGSEFYYIKNNGEDRIKLMKTSMASNSSSQFIAHTKDIISLDVNTQQEVAATRLITWADGRVWADVYLLKEGAWLALTAKQRLQNVRWLNNDWLIATRKQYGISQLVLLNKQGEQTLLWQGDDERTVIGDYDIAASGDYIIAAMKRPNQGWNLERLNLERLNTSAKGDFVSPQSWQLITQTKAVENSPQILTDGRILYSANYDGIYNLHLLNPITGHVTPLTQMLGGAFSPKFIRAKKGAGQDYIIFQAYTETGFEFRQLTFTDIAGSGPQSIDKGFNIKKEYGQLNYPDAFSFEVEKKKPLLYQPWSSLMPTWWLPYAFTSSESTIIGALTAGTDALGQHTYSMQVSTDTQYNLTNLNASYLYDTRYQFLFDRRHTYNKIKNVADYVVEQDRWIFSRLNMVNAIEDQLALNSAIIIEKEGTVSQPKLLTIPCIDGNFNFHKRCKKSLLGLGLKFDNRESYLNSPGFSSGRYIDLVIESNDILESDYSGQVYQGQWLEIFDLPGWRSLSLQTLWGKVNKGGERFTLGGENRGSENILFGRDDFALRGYPPAAINGQYLNVNRINYTQWLARIEKGLYNWPIAVGDLSAQVFIDYGSAWQESTSAHYVTGIGVELNVEILAFYNFILPVSLIYAHGVDSKLGGDRFSMGFGLPF